MHLRTRMSFMSSNRSRLLLTLACVLGRRWRLRQAFPPAAATRKTTPGSEHRRARRLAVQLVDGPANEPSRPQRNRRPLRRRAADSGVQQASATDAICPSAVGPLVPGPSSSAGPPPAIPAELPPPPAGAISISDVKLKEEEKKGFELSDLRRRTSTRT